ncbi:hypothetical protein O6H91_13G003600 [Diphasiastrum complanatum]|uniref:Uncharacterized protein n=1 Tax=Diphasiastrum complanatum TaxID=34168 RepID=A0ACC2BRR8_DIPCM|nr:hypothetical protein O6H91_13G003600 [Diphasiastrum complanatum]
MVILKNVSQAKFDRILLPIARICVAEAQRTNIEFNSFFLHTLCHECCHGIGPHNIVLPDGQHSTVRLELEELHSALEEAKADIVGLWALQYLIDQGLLSKDLEKAVYVSFLAGCFRSIRFGLQEAHGKGQALQFNWIFENGGFVQNGDKTFAVDFNKIKGAVESLSREIMNIQAQGNKVAARLLLERYAVLTPDLHGAINKLENFQIPVDIAPSFDILQLLEGKSLG